MVDYYASNLESKKSKEKTSKTKKTLLKDKSKCNGGITNIWFKLQKKLIRRCAVKRVIQNIKF